MNRKLVVYGAGSLTKEILCYNDVYKLFDVIAIVDDNDEHPSHLLDVPIISFSDLLKMKIHKDDFDVIVSIGYTACSSYRQRTFEKLESHSFNITNFVSPRVTSWIDVSKVKNLIILDNVFIGPYCKLGHGCIICPGCILSHDVVVNDFCFLSDGVVIGGNAVIGRNTFIGLNSTIKSSTRIGEKNIVASAANVINDSQPSSVLKGNPAISIIKDTMLVKI